MGEIGYQIFELFITIGLVSAPSIDIERMMAGGEVVEFACCLDNFLDPGVTEFDYISSIHIDQVIVLHAVICFFKLCNVFPKLMFYNEVTVE